METALLTDQAKDGRGAGQDGENVEYGEHRSAVRAERKRRSCSVR